MPLSISPGGSLTQSLLAQRDRNIARTGQALERLSTGKRINRASDDPAGFVSAEELRGEITRLNAELKNFERQGFSLAERESTLASVQRQLSDIRGQVIGAAGNQLGDDQRHALQQSVDASIESINRLAEELAPQAISELGSGGGANLVDGDAAQAAAIIDSTNESVGLDRTGIAAEQRALDALERVAEDTLVNSHQALSQIEDADFAKEASNLAASQILTQAATAALVYSQRSNAGLISGLLDEIVA